MARAFESLVEMIASQINAGDLPAGTRLDSERDLSEKYGVSRITVREALLALQSRGLILLKNRARAEVCGINSSALLSPLSGAAQSLLAKPGGVSEFQEVRILFECGLARHAARHASPKEIDRLGVALLENRRAIGDIERFIDTDMAFHAILAEIPHHNILVAINAALSGWLHEQRAIGLRARGAERRAYKHHEAVFEAIAAHSPEDADRAMSDHLTVGARIIGRQLR